MYCAQSACPAPVVFVYVFVAEASARRVSPGGRGGPDRTFLDHVGSSHRIARAPTGNRTPLDRILGTRTTMI